MNEAAIQDTIIAVRMTARARAESAGATASAALWDDAEARARLATADAVRREADLAGLGAGLTVPETASADEIAAALSAVLRPRQPPRALIRMGGAGAVVLASHAGEVWAAMAKLRGQPTAGLSPAQPQGRAAGCVAVVTGSAQGLGRGIAEELAAEGASVWIADVNDAAGQAAAKAVNERWGLGAAAYGRMDVTDGTSIARSLADCVRTFGGVDLFVANAGVLKAGGLDEMDEAGFDLVTAVNYKGYFLCVRAAAAIMKRQHAVHPEYWMDIIQINSKSGLEGSNRNFAYAGSKFGGIGLTQSFALELLPWRIKVNAICPGNYFEGPLWSDPQKGLFVQYLRAGKVPGARTVDDVKAAYLAKIPMGRGCQPRDVARAILYLREQEYETGQAVPVTGGQVMLR